MAPKSKSKGKKGESSQPSSHVLPTAEQIEAWLYHEPRSMARYKYLSSLTSFHGIFHDLDHFPTYRIKLFTDRANITSLIDYKDNQVNICRLSVLLFLANVNNPQIRLHREKGTLWTSVYGNILKITPDDIARILKCANDGIELEDFKLEGDDLDQIEYHLFEPGQSKDRSNHLRPRPRLLLRMLIKTIFPRQGSHEIIYDNEDKALQAVFGNHQINWAQYFYDEFRTYHDSKKRSLIYAPYITRILADFSIQNPPMEVEKIKVSNIRFFSLMGLPESPPVFLTYPDYKAQQIALQKGKTKMDTSDGGEPNIGEEEEEDNGDEEEDDDEAIEQTFIKNALQENSDIEQISGNFKSYTKSEKLKSDIIVSKNQKKLSNQITQGFSSINTRFDNLDAKVEENAREMKNIKTILRRMWKNSYGSSPPPSPTWGDS